MALRIIIGLALTAVAFAIAGRRLWWLFRIGRSGQPAPERIQAVREHPGRDAEAEFTEVLGQRKLLKWSAARHRPFPDVLGLHPAVPDHHRVLRRPVQQDLRDPRDRALGRDRVPGGPVRRGGARRPRHFSVIRFRNNPKEEGRKSRFYGSHTGMAWVVLFLIFMVVATMLIYRGAQINTGDFPYARGAFASQIVGHWLAPARQEREPGDRDHLHPGAARGGPRLPGGRHVLQAPAHRRGPAERAVLPPPQRAARAAADALGRQGARLRGGRPGRRRLRPRQDRGLHLEGHAGHGHLHRVRALPVAVPGLGDRQAAVTEAADPGPARSRVREGPVPAGRIRRGPGEAARLGAGRGGAPPGRRRGRARRDRSRRALVLHQLRRLRGGVPGRHRAHRPHHRHAPASGADRVRLPHRGGLDAEEPGEQGRPVGHGRGPAAGLGRGPGLRGAGRGRPDRRRTSSTCSGWAAPGRWRTGPARPPGRSPICCTRPGSRSRSSGRPRPAPATRRGGSATSSCSRCWPSRTSRR